MVKALNEDPTGAALDREIALMLGLDLKAKESEYQQLSIRFYAECSDQEVKDLMADAHCSIRRLWSERVGQAWQTSIEEYFATWERDPPPYSSDIAVAFTLGEEMAKRGLFGSYAVSILCVLFGNEVTMPHMIHEDDLGALAHATAAQRALAAWRCLKGREGSQP